MIDFASECSCWRYDILLGLSHRSFSHDCNSETIILYIIIALGMVYRAVNVLFLRILYDDASLKKHEKPTHAPKKRSVGTSIVELKD